MTWLFIDKIERSEKWRVMGIIIIHLAIVDGEGCGMVVHRLMTGGFLINHGQLES